MGFDDKRWCKVTLSQKAGVAGEGEGTSCRQGSCAEAQGEERARAHGMLAYSPAEERKRIVVN